VRQMPQVPFCLFDFMPLFKEKGNSENFWRRLIEKTKFAARS